MSVHQDISSIAFSALMARRSQSPAEEGSEFAASENADLAVEIATAMVTYITDNSIVAEEIPWATECMRAILSKQIYDGTPVDIDALVTSSFYNSNILADLIGS